MHRPITVLDAPSNLGLRPPRPGAEPGASGLARAMRARSLLRRLGADDGGEVARLPYAPGPDARTGFRNGEAIARYSAALAERTRAIVAAGRFALVLGGDCSVLLGNMLALRGLGRYGLVFLDGHDDFSPPRDAERYRGVFAAAGQDLALATGHGPAALTDLEGRRPYVAEEDVAVLGLNREPADARDYAVERFDESRIARWPLAMVRALGARTAAEQIRARMEAAPLLDGFWIHVDADVLDQAVMPAVDSPNPGGLGFAELTEALSVLLASPRAVGLELTIYDPELDPSGAAGDGLATAVVEAFAEARARPHQGAPARPPLAEVLEAPSSAAEHAEALRLYGQFVGDWELDVTDHAADGTRRTRHGEWRFGWILEGRAVQDVWRVPALGDPGAAGRPPTGFGTTVRTYDPKRDQWTVVWNGAVTGTVIRFTGRRQGDEIVQEGVDPESGLPTRWIFSDIRPESFRWRSVRSPDGGHTWQLEQEMVVRRRRAP